MTTRVFEFFTHNYIGSTKNVDVLTLIRYIGMFPMAFDLVALRYRHGASLPMHKHEVKGFKCYRFNLSYN